MSRWSELKKSVHTILNVPRVTVIGTYQVYIENHQGILEFTSQRLRLRMEAGQLHITGRGLTIRHVNREEMFVEGEHIASLTFTD